MPEEINTCEKQDAACFQGPQSTAEIAKLKGVRTHHRRTTFSPPVSTAGSLPM